jgi:flagellar motor switch protein FliN/FliY
VQQVLRLEVPFVVQLGSRTMRVSEVVRLLPGSILELAKHADAELDLLVNRHPIGTGTAVKVGENFGVRISYIGDARSRMAAMGMEASKAKGGGSGGADVSPEQLAEALLSGQL